MCLNWGGFALPPALRPVGPTPPAPTEGGWPLLTQGPPRCQRLLLPAPGPGWERLDVPRCPDTSWAVAAAPEWGGVSSKPVFSLCHLVVHLMLPSLGSLLRPSWTPSPSLEDPSLKDTGHRDCESWILSLVNQSLITNSVKGIMGRDLECRLSSYGTQAQ